MPLSAGMRLGPYEVVAPIGAGGMGEVWRARDANLHRDVALKVIPDLFATDPERLARFRREAQLLASLSHPNIAIIHGFEEANGINALVLEFVDGPTLADRIAQGPLPVDETLIIARQICEALEAAHQQGIVHRDLKPANIKLRPDGTVKVLDFGLAKALAAETDGGRSSDLSRSPTITIPDATRMGVVLGTAGYMSPEQARGHSVNEQSDIWSFGVVLYEMLTGKAAFPGETITDVLAGIVKTDPDWTTLPEQTPATVRLLLRQCLQKNRTARLHHIADARIAIDASMSEPVMVTTTVRPRRTLPQRVLVWMAVPALVLLGAASTFLLQRYLQAEPSTVGVVRLAVPPPEEGLFTGGPNAPYIALSPDGRHLAFIATVQGTPRIWLRSLDTLDARELAGTEGVTMFPPFWSPDSRFIAYFTLNGKLRKVDLTGGPAQTLCDATVTNNPSGTWNRDNVIVFGGGNQPLRRVPAAGGTPELVTALDESRQELSHHWPTFLEDGDHFFYLARSEVLQNSAIFLGSLKSQNRSLVIAADSRIAYDPSGYLLFVREASLMALPFDAGTLLPKGDPVLVAANVRSNTAGQASLTVSGNGVLAYRAGDANRNTLVWFDRSGKQLGTVGAAGLYQNIELAPDDKRVALSRTDWQSTSQDIYVIDTVRGQTTKVTFGAQQANGVWSPDGERIAYQLLGNDTIYANPANGAGTQTVLVKGTGQLQGWSSDGQFLITSDRTAIWAVPLAGDRTPIPYLAPGGFARGQPQLSFDGRWLAYHSNESGRNEVYIQSFPTPSVRIHVSTNGGTSPRWRRDGKEIFYIGPGLKLMAVSLTASGTTLETSTPTPLFDIPITTAARPQYDVTSDGQRILVNSTADAVETPVTVVVNWVAGLKG